MTGNQIKGKGFRGALRYNLDKVERNVAEVLDHSFARVSENSIMKEIQLVRVLRPNLQKYFYHTSINFPPNEDLSNDMMRQIGHDYLKANGFTQHQFIMFRHNDAGHPHLHILVNRIGYDGNVLSDSNDYKRSENVLRDLEAKYNLTRVTPSKEVKERAMTKDELEMMRRTNKPSQKMLLQIFVRDVLKQKPHMTTREFIRALQDKGVNVLFNQATTGFVSGISYDYRGFTIKGAKLGNDFKWSSIKKSIDYDQERDSTIIRETNLGTKANRYDHGAVSYSSKSVDRANSGNDYGSRRKGGGFDLESLKYDLIYWHDRDLNSESHPETGGLGRPRKKKKRRGIKR